MNRLALALALAALLAVPAMAGTGHWGIDQPGPGDGAEPVNPTDPARPGRQNRPGRANRPGKPTQPTGPTQPVQPVQPKQPAQPKQPKPPGPGAEPAGGTEPEPGVRIEKAADVVILTDGTKIVCTIVAVGQKRLLIIEEGAARERAVERSEVESFHRGGGSGRTLSYAVERDTLNGVLILKEQSGTDTPGTAPVNPTPDPGPKPGPDPGPKPKADLGGLWKLLEGKPSAQALGDAFARNPDWGPAISELTRTKTIPPEARKAVESLQARLRDDKDFTAGLADLVIKGKLPRGVLEILTQK